MKLTIKSPAGLKEVMDLNKDLLFNTEKGEQYIFSKGFTNYVLNFKDNQKSVELTFNIEGKSVKVELKGIVPFLQENIPDSENPTAIIINKNISDKDIDELVDNEAFNGSEIIDRLEAIISKPVELGNDVNNSDDVALISDFQTLIESLDAAAAGPGAGQGNATGNGSTFNSIFSSLDDSLNGIADTNIWENLPESINSIPVETGPTLATTAVITSALVSISGTQTIIEGDISTAYTVSVNQLAIDVVSPIIITLIYTGTALDGIDFTGVTTVTIPAGSNSVDFNISTLNDEISEFLENYTITIGTITDTNFGNISVNTDSNFVVTTIIDNDVPTISVGKPGDVGTADITVPEGSDAVFAVEVSKAAIGSTLTLTLADGTALDADYFANPANGGKFQYSIDGGVTYQDVTGPIALSAGNTNLLVSTDTIDDLIDEANETFTLTGKLTSNGADYSDTATATIIDNDVPTISVGKPGDVGTADITVPEGSDAVFAVEVSKAAIGSTLTLTLADGTALDADYFANPANGGKFQYSIDGGVTYQDVTGPIALSAGNTNLLVSTDTIDDLIDEANETFTLTGKLTSNGADYSDTATATIIDNDVPTISVGKPGDVGTADITVPEGSDAVFAVEVSKAAIGSTLTLTLADGTALDADYFANPANGGKFQYSIDGGVTYQDVTGPIALSAGNTNLLVSTDTIDDLIDEANETFTLTGKLTSNGADYSDTATATIIDNDVPTISVGKPGDVGTADITVPEGSDAVFAVEVSKAAIGSTLTLTLADGTALDADYFANPANGGKFQYSIDGGVTYQDVTGPIALSAGNTNLLVSTDTIDDLIDEANETFTLTGKLTSNGADYSDTATATIIDNDVPTISVGKPGDVGTADITVPEGSDAVFAVEVSKAAIGSTLTLTLADGTALDADYFANPANGGKFQYSIDGGVTYQDVTGPIALSAGNTNLLVSTDTIDDLIDEANETFTLTGKLTSNGADYSDTATATIIDNDVPTISVGKPGDVGTADITVPEGSDAVFAVEVSKAAIGSTLTLTLADGTALDADYFANPANGGKFQYSIDGGVTYQDVTGPIALSAGNTNLLVSTDTIDDLIDEANETFTLTGKLTSNGADYSDTATATIIDNDVPTISVGKPGDVGTADITVPEGSDAVFAVEVSKAAIGSTLTLTLADGTALDADYFANPANGGKFQYSIDGGVTYQDVTGPIALSAGNTNLLVSTDTIDDLIDEANETFTLTGKLTSNGADYSDTATATIIDNDVPTISVGKPGDVGTADITVPEGSDAVFAVEVSKAAIGSTLTLTLADGTALDADYFANPANGGKFQYSIDGGVTYQDVTGPIALSAGNTNLLVSTDTIDDLIDEANETFTLTGKLTSNGADYSDTATATIIDNDVPTISVGKPGDVGTADITVPEGSDAVFAVEVSKAAIGSTLTLTLADGTALDADYFANPANGGKFQYSIDGGVTYQDVTGPIALSAGNTNLLVSTDTIDDLIDEANETFTLTGKLTSNGADYSDTATATIIDNDVPTISVGKPGDVGTADITVPEGSDAVFAVEVSKAAIGSTLTLTLADGTALDADYFANPANGGKFQYSIDGGVTYQDVTGPIALSAGNTNLLVSTDTIDDLIDEANETFTLTGKLTSNGADYSDTATATIIDNDVPTISVGKPGDVGTADITVPEGSDAVFAVEVSKAAIGSTLTLTLADGTALDADYFANPANGGKFQYSIDGGVTYQDVTGPIALSAGNTNLLVSTDTIDDLIDEANETFTLTGKLTSNGADYSDTATATIIDNDVPTISVGKPGDVGTADITVPEGSDAVFAVEVSKAAIGSTLTLTLADGTALDADYFANPANGGKFQYSIDGGVTYQDVTGPIALSAGNTNLLVSTDTIDDLIDEANETFTLTGKLTSNGADYSDTATATIIDNDVPTISVGKPGDVGTADITVPEGSDAVFAVEVSKAAIGSTLTLTLADGTALDADYFANPANGGKFQYSIDGGVTYQDVTGPIALSAGNTNLLVSTDTIDDLIDEANETFTLTGKLTSNGADYSDTATATIIDNDVPTISVGKPGDVGTADITVPEGSDAVFAVEVSKAAIGSTLTLTLADGTALDADYFANPANGGKFQYSIDGGVTYQDVTGPIALSAGNTNLLVSTDTIDDLIDEANETFTLTGKLTSNGADYSDTATATIIDNDVPTISVGKPGDVGTADITVPEGSDAVFAVEVSKAAIGSTLTLTLADGTALDADYFANPANGGKFQYSIDGGVTYQDVTGPIALSAGNTNLLVSTDTIDDLIDEANETFTLTGKLTSNGADYSDTATATIIDNDVPTISVGKPGDVGTADITVPEGSDAVFAVEVSKAAIGSTLTLTLADGTALDADYFANPANGGKFQYSIDGGVTYQDVTGPIALSAGNTNLLVSTDTIDDLIDEANETFTLTGKLTSNGADYSDTATATIIDNDVPTISVGKPGDVGTADITVPEGSDAVFAVEVSKAAIGSTLTLTLADGTALDADYFANPANGGKFQYSIDGGVTYQDVTGPIALSAGNTNLLVSTDTIDDLIDEANETFTLTGKLTSNGADYSDTATATIIDNDVPTISVGKPGDVGTADITVPEGSDAVFAVEVSKAAIGSTLTLTLADGTALDADYFANPANGGKFQYSIDGGVTYQDVTGPIALSAGNTNLLVSTDTIDDLIDEANETFTLTGKLTSNGADYSDTATATIIDNDVPTISVGKPGDVGTADITVPEGSDAVFAVEVSKAAIGSTLTLTLADGTALDADYFANPANGGKFQYSIDGGVTYQDVTGPIALSAGNTNLLVSTDTIDDLIDEANETFTLTGKLTSNGADYSDTATATIIDNDVPTISVGKPGDVGTADITVPEGSDAVFAVEVSKAAIGSTLTLTLADGTALDADYFANPANGGKFQYSIDGGVTYQDVTGPIALSAGNTNLLVSTDTIDDLIDEANETFTLTGKLTSNGADYSDTATATIIDNDVPTISVGKPGDVGTADITVPEGSDAVFAVEVSKAAIGSTLTLTLADGTALDADYFANPANGGKFQYSIDGGVTYQDVTGPIALSAGNTNLLVSTDTIDDLIDEANETFTLTGKLTSNGADYSDTATATIIDNDVPTISVGKPGDVGTADITVPEGSDAVFAVEVSKAAIGSTLTLTLADGTALDADYFANPANGGKFQYSIDGGVTYQDVTGPIALSAGNTNLLVSTDTIDDLIDEANETFTLTGKLTSNGADYSDTATATIIDNDVPTISVGKPGDVGTADITVPEGSDAVFAVEVSKAAIGSTLTLTLADGTALDADYFANPANGGKFQYSIDGGVTYQDVTGPIALSAGNTNLLVSTDTIDDLIDEANETFTLTGKLTSNGADYSDTATATIIDNDVPTISVGKPGDVGTADITVPEGSDAVFAVEVSKAAIGSTLTLTLADGTALDADYFANPANGGKFQYSIDGGVTYQDVTGPIALSAGNTNLLVSTDTIDDLIDEANETFTLTGKLTSNGADYSDTATATIIDNDVPTISVGKPGDVGTADITVPEGSDAVFAVEVSKAAIGSTLTLTLADGTALDADYFANPANGGKFQYSIDGGVTYQDVTGPIALSAGNTNLLVSTDTIDDLIDEANETFTLTGKLTSNGADYSDTATATIIDNDVPTISVGKPGDVGTADITVPEGSDAVFAVEVSKAAIGSTLTLTLADGTALDADYFANPANGGKFQYSIDGGVTYQDVTGPIALSAGNTNLLVSTDTIDDLIDEANETFTLTGKLTSNGADYSDTATATIIDNDVPTISVGKPGDVGTADITVPEGSDAVFAVEVSKAAIGSTLTLTLADGTALDADYFANPANGGKFQYSIDGGVTYQDVTGPIALSAGNTNLLVSTDTIDDLIDEANETFTLTGKLTSNGADYSDTATATIIDNDVPTISVGKPGDVGTADITVPEGSDAVFAVEVSKAAIGSTLTLTLADGTALDADYFANPANGGKFQYSIDGGVTYQDVTGPIALSAGNTNLLVSTDTIDDLIDEANETFTLTGKLTSNGADYSDTATATIIDNDVPTISVGKPGDVGTADITVPEGSDAVFAVEVSKAAIGSTLTLTLADGTALDADYFANPANGGKFQYSIDGGVTYQDVTGPIALSAGNTNLLVSTDTIDDLIDEANETFTLTGKLTSNGADYSDTATATIIDNDVPTISVGKPGDVGTADITVPEGSDAVFAVEVSKAAIGSTLTLTLADGTALDADYFANPANGGKFQYSIDGGVTYQDVTGPIALSAGNTNLLVSTDTIDDLIDEANETFTLTGKLTSNGADYSDTATATIIDNDVPTKANNDIVTAVEDGKEYITSQDEVADDKDGTGNLLINDTGTNNLITTLTVLGTVYTVPTNGSDISINTKYGQIIIKNTGEYIYEIDNSNLTVDSLNIGNTLLESISYTISDGVNHTSSANLDITIQGQDDAPTITLITGNNQGYKVASGLLDLNGNGVVDTINSDDLTKVNGGITYLTESGDLNINMGTLPSTMTVEYNGSQSSYHNALGFYTADENGNPITARIIYVENNSLVGSKSEMLGTLNGLTGNVGFFIIPNGGADGITTSSSISFDSNNKMYIGGILTEAYFTDNDLNTDGLDHVVAGKAKDGNGLVIGFEDLKLDDKDYDDFVITINACETLGQTIKTTIFTENFENINHGIDENIGGTGWYVDHGTNGDNILVSSNGNIWSIDDDAGIEIRQSGYVDYVSTANGSDGYIELDPNTFDKNASISTQVNLGTNDTYVLSFDFTPRPTSTETIDSSDMTFSLAGQVVQINVDSVGAVTYFAPAGVDVTITKIIGTDWYKINATFTNIISNTATLNFSGAGDADTAGAYVDNIKLVGNHYSIKSNTILTNIDLSDVDNSILSSASVKLTNYKTGDNISEPTVNTYGITVSIINGTVSLSGVATIAQYEEVLKSLTFISSSEDRTPRKFEFTVNDGLKDSNKMLLTLDIGGCSLNPSTSPNSVIANNDYGYDMAAQGEFKVSSYASSSYQSEPDVTSLKDGGYVIVWSEISGSSYNGAVVNDLNDDGDINDAGETVFDTRQNYDVFMQRYDSDGELVGESIRVNTFVDNVNENGGRSQHDVNVVSLANGNILITWTSDDQYVVEDGYDNGSRYIQGQIYDENGNAICKEFTISRAEYDPIIGLPDGGFIVTWSADSRFNNTDGFAGNPINNPILSDAHDGSGNGIIAQRFDAYGNEVGDRLIVNQLTDYDQIDSDITMINNNTAIMTWQSQNGLNGDFDIYAQIIKLTDTGLQIVSNSDISVALGSSNQTNPEITALKDGSAVITYSSDSSIMIKTISSNGSIGSEMEVSVSGSNAVITSLSVGFVIAYENNGAIYTKTFDGTTLSSAVKVSINNSNQTLSSISSLEDGGYIVVWQDANGISAHRYTANGSEFIKNNYDLNEDTSITISVDNLMANDIDPEGNSFNITSVSNALNGTVVLNDTNNDGIYDSITFTPNKDYNGSATFDYTITDELGAIDTATVYLDVKPVGEPSVFIGALCSSDVKGINVTVSEGEEAILAVKVSGADLNTTLSLSLSDGTAINSDYASTLYYSFVNENTNMNNITWIEYTNNISVPENASTMLVKTNTILDAQIENNEFYNLTARLSTGETGTGTINIVDYEDIDLSSLISANTDIISFENTTRDKITVELNDLIADDDKQLIIKGDIGDIVQLDTPSDWSNAGKQQLDGVSYNVFTGTGTNSTIKLLIDDDIDVTPDI